MFRIGSENLSDVEKCVLNDMASLGVNIFLFRIGSENLSDVEKCVINDLASHGVNMFYVQKCFICKMTQFIFIEGYDP